MGFVGRKPTNAPLTSSDLGTGIVGSTNIADGTIVNDDINASAAIAVSKLTGTLPVANGGTGLTALGTSLQVLRTNTGATALEFATISTGAAAGQVIQVVTATDQTARSTTSLSFVTASNTLSVTITPSSTANKILILVGASIAITDNAAWFTIYRDATDLGNTSNTRGMATAAGGGVSAEYNMGINYLDSPNTTSAITYQVYFRINTNNTAYLNANSTKSSITCLEIKG